MKFVFEIMYKFYWILMSNWGTSKSKDQTQVALRPLGYIKVEISVLQGDMVGGHFSRYLSATEIIF